MQNIIFLFFIILVKVFERPRLVWKFCQDQDQYISLTGHVLSFETKTKSVTERISSAGPLILFIWDFWDQDQD